MKRRSIVSLAALVCALSPLSALAAAPNAKSVELPAGTPLSVHLNAKLSSRTARVSDRFTFIVTRDVRSGGWLLIPAGAQGTGEVTSVETAAMSGQPGALGLRFDSVSAVDGHNVVIAQNTLKTEGKPTTGAASHRWSRGHEASLTPATVFSIAVGTTTSIDAIDHLTTTNVNAH